MFVAASSECFPNLSLDGVLNRLVDLEYTAVEIALHEQDGPVKPSQVLADFEKVLAACRETYRLTIGAYSFDADMQNEELYYKQFEACCHLAKGTKVVSMAVPSSELGTPFNAEIERLRKLVAIAAREGVVVGVKTQIGRMTQDPDTAQVMCDNVKGLGITLDPSHYICGPGKGNYDHLLKHVVHVHLRDTSKQQLQVRVGQGEVEYGKLVSQLSKYNYNRALSVHMAEMEGVDHAAEMRKMRLLLESLL